MKRRWEKPRGVCECGDSIRTALGTCPERGHREFLCCPKQDVIKTKREETGK
ncbi:hypothetical protein KGG72_gp52 [Streptomyces phage Salutena]|uniref:Uncharacterized protein n=1 Tax=Streptomyces phage Salutena TaxID=2767576 RepID=A0A7S6TXA1_9CAUD|nr:hypothetical protein KGG72_gp52 [Streptomyces phage Salutena]QOV06182.1 hypothetical protein CPT_Salutena_052 [Streptomyces phage Salutena]